MINKETVTWSQYTDIWEESLMAEDLSVMEKFLNSVFIEFLGRTDIDVKVYKDERENKIKWFIELNREISKERSEELWKFSRDKDIS